MALLADFFTFSRLIISIMIVILGIHKKLRTFRYMIFLLLLGWTTDILDGKFARSASVASYLSSFDFIVDVILIISSFTYLFILGLVSKQFFTFYILAILLIAFISNSKSMVMLISFPLTILPFIFAYYLDIASFLISLIWLTLVLISQKGRFFEVIAEFAEGFPFGLLKSTANFFRKLSKHPS
ncbi:MAG: CDP-alcohol phosphatidyltransferase family protein [Actinobacteria bacterium]|nr:CDP-alcohol phosphatidyltransferase family protein [Actinomycetota bacterium]